MSFRFGEVTHQSLGTLEIRMPAPETGFNAFKIDVIDLDVPMLIGLRELKRNDY